MTVFYKFLWEVPSKLEARYFPLGTGFFWGFFLLNRQNPWSVMTKVICRHSPLKLETSFFIIKVKVQQYGWSMGSECYRFKFLEGIRLHWLFYVGLGEIRFLKWHNVISSNSWFLAILKEFSGLPLFKLIFFFLKLNRILTKIDISHVKS